MGSPLTSHRHPSLLSLYHSPPPSPLPTTPPPPSPLPTTHPHHHPSLPLTPTITPPYHSPPPSPLPTTHTPPSPLPTTHLDTSNGLNEQIHFPARNLPLCLLHQFPRPILATDGKGCLQRQAATSRCHRKLRVASGRPWLLCLSRRPHLNLSWWW